MAALRVDRGRLALDGQFWGLSTKWSATLLATPLVGAALLALTYRRPGLYRALVREDAALEWVQFAAYAAAAGFAGATALRLRSHRVRRPSLLFGLLACCCLFAAAEEVSWGQRLFDLDTPDPLEAVNKQEELNVHDVAEVQGIFSAGLALASLYGLCAPVLSRRPSLVVPPLALGTAFLAAFVYTSGRALFFPHPSYEVAKYSEWPETCFAGALAIFALLSLRAVGTRTAGRSRLDAEPG